MTTPATRPRLYGYFRVPDGMNSAAVLNARQTLADFAKDGGFELVDIYEDGGPGHRLQVLARHGGVLSLGKRAGGGGAQHGQLPPHARTGDVHARGTGREDQGYGVRRHHDARSGQP